MNCKQGTHHIIEQMIGLLESMPTEAYQQSLPIFKGSSIGQHFRHILDFYNCLMSGLGSDLVDYAKRERNVLMETEVNFAKGVLLEIDAKIEICDEQKEVEVVADFTADHLSSRPTVKSSVGRELMYAYDHAVHHLAMIKMGIRVAFPDLEVDESVGVAPSTLKHWKKQVGVAN